MLNKKQFNPILNLCLERGKDYSVNINIENQIMQINVCAPGSNEFLRYQCSVDHEDSKCGSIDLRKFMTIIDKIKAVHIFTITQNLDKLEIKIYDKSEKEIDSKRLPILPQVNPMQHIKKKTAKISVATRLLERVNVFEKCKVYLGLAPEFSKVAVINKDDTLYFLSSDGICVMKMELPSCSSIDASFSSKTISPTGIKNLRLFEEESIDYQYILFDDTQQAIQFSSKNTTYRLPLEDSALSFYTQDGLQYLFQNDITYVPIWEDIQEDDVKNLKALMTKIKKDCEKEEKYEVVIQVKNDGLYYQEELVYPIAFSTTIDIDAKVNGYDLVELLTQYDVEKVGRKSVKKYQIEYSQYVDEKTKNVFAVLKNHNLYMFTKQ